MGKTQAPKDKGKASTAASSADTFMNDDEKTIRKNKTEKAKLKEVTPDGPKTEKDSKKGNKAVAPETKQDKPKEPKSRDTEKKGETKVKAKDACTVREGRPEHMQDKQGGSQGR